MIQERIDALNLDEPFLVQYWLWLKGAVTCFVPGGGCDLGYNLNNQPVSALIADALPTTLAARSGRHRPGDRARRLDRHRDSAIRQYSAFDYSITFAAFLFFSLPIFWVAVLLKEFGAIRINDWLAAPAVTHSGRRGDGDPERALLQRDRRRYPTQTTPDRACRRGSVLC